MRSWTPPAVSGPVGDAVRQVMDPFGFAPGTVAKNLAEAIASRLLGRDLEIRFGAAQIELVLRSLRMTPSPLGIVIGQLGDVEVEVDDVRSGDLRLAHVRITARNMHIQPGPPPVLVAAPVWIEATVDQSAVDGVVARRSARAEVELTGEGTAKAGLLGRRRWGHVDLVPKVEGHTLALDPTSVTLRGRRLTGLARMLPRFRIPLPEQLAKHHVSEVNVADGTVVVRALLEEWREPLTAGQLDQIAARIRRFTGRVLDLPRTAP